MKSCNSFWSSSGDLGVSLESVMSLDISCAKTKESTTFGGASKSVMSNSLKILALEPYYNISHRVFLEGYKRYSRHDIKIWSLPGRKWKW
ncbi:MAG: DUF3524 domain-containing protein, partial [Planctomycetota bacterium]|nr:DUF3524 domain-containing protein [Planctomycetota bacterium]